MKFKNSLLILLIISINVTIAISLINYVYYSQNHETKSELALFNAIKLDLGLIDKNGNSDLKLIVEENIASKSNKEANKGFTLVPKLDRKLKNLTEVSGLDLLTSDNKAKSLAAGDFLATVLKVPIVAGSNIERVFDNTAAQKAQLQITEMPPPNLIEYLDETTLVINGKDEEIGFKFKHGNDDGKTTMEFNMKFKSNPQNLSLMTQNLITNTALHDFLEYGASRSFKKGASVNFHKYYIPSYEIRETTEIINLKKLAILLNKHIFIRRTIIWGPEVVTQRQWGWEEILTENHKIHSAIYLDDFKVKVLKEFSPN